MKLKVQILLGANNSKLEYCPIHVDGALQCLPDRGGYIKWPCLGGVPRHIFIFTNKKFISLHLGVKCKFYP
jgi:hypothetical protein